LEAANGELIVREEETYMVRSAAAKAAENPYGVHPGVAMVQKWVMELKEKTGRSLDEWLALIKKEGPKDEKAQREWLKSKHKLGTNSAWWLAERAAGKNTEDNDPELYLRAAVQYVQEQYAGGKEGLRALYDVLLEVGKSLGQDVKACPCKTIVPLYRKHVFAQIKPTTNSRIDLGFALGHYKGKMPKRVIVTGGAAKKDRITHRIEIQSASDIDDEVKRWLKTAYELDK
jgi:hypothetical protein